MKRIIVRLQGGLGNQLFQLAYAKKQYLEGGFNEVVLDTSYFKRKRIQQIQLNKIKLDKEVLMKSESDVWVELFYAIYRGIFRLYFKFSANDDMQMFIRTFRREIFFCKKKADEYVNKRNIRYCAGYYQSCEIAEYIKYDDYKVMNMGLQAEMYYEKIKNCDETIAVSIRMGEDYKRFGWPVCKKVYYTEGVKRLLSIYPHASIFVFSDCINDVETENWFSSFQRVTLVKGINAPEGIALMKECNNFVISNSTFAWWGAHLSKNNEKNIVAPKFFYRGKEMKGSLLDNGEMVFLDNFTGALVV